MINWEDWEAWRRPIAAVDQEPIARKYNEVRLVRRGVRSCDYDHVIVPPPMHEAVLDPIDSDRGHSPKPPGVVPATGGIDRQRRDRHDRQDNR